MSSNSETPVDALNQQEVATDAQKQQQQHNSNAAVPAAAAAASEEVTEALQVSERTSATPNSPDDDADGQDEDRPTSTTVPTIEEPAADASATQKQPLKLQPSQLSPAAVVGAAPSPRSPVSPSRYTIDDDDDDYYEDGFEGGQLTILQGPGQQSTSASGASAAPKEAPVFDIHAELDFVKARLETIALDPSDPKTSEERVALQELQKSTEMYIESQDVLAAKQQQLSHNLHNEGVRVVLASQVDQLTEESNARERQWSATKQVYHREFGELMDSPRKLSSVRAKTEVDIRQLQDQIAHLQRQLDTVAARRRQMMADAEEHRRRYAEAGLDD